MKGMRSKTVMVLVAAGMLLATTPAFAFVAVACTAKNSVGKTFRNETFGWFEFDSKISATSYAMADCQAKSAKPGSCKIKECHVTHW